MNTDFVSFELSMRSLFEDEHGILLDNVNVIEKQREVEIYGEYVEALVTIKIVGKKHKN